MRNLHRGLAERRRWISEDRLLHALKLLHAVPRSRGPAASDLHGLAHARDLRRDCCRRFLCDSFNFHPPRALITLCDLRKCPSRRWCSGGYQASRCCYRRRGSVAHQLSVLTFVLLARWRLDVLLVIFAGGAIGLGRALFLGA